VLLACAAFLAIGQILVGPPMRPMPDLAVSGATALLPLVVAVRITRFAGAATAACGAYLLPASTVSLLIPSVPPPLLLLVSAVVYDLTLWLRPETHLSRLLEFLPRHRTVRQRRPVPAHGTSPRRAAVAGAAFGLALAVVEPPFRVLLGGDASIWSGPSLWVAAAAAALSCAIVGTLLTFRGTAA
jgi:hypothetical protein